MFGSLFSASRYSAWKWNLPNNTIRWTAPKMKYLLIGSICFLVGVGIAATISVAIEYERSYKEQANENE